jgi:hypothetical protein
MYIILVGVNYWIVILGSLFYRNFETPFEVKLYI